MDEYLTRVSLACKRDHINVGLDWLVALISLEDIETFPKSIPAMFSWFLLTGTDCKVQNGQNVFDSVPGLPPGYFMMGSGLQRSIVCMGTGFGLYLLYNEAPEAELTEHLKWRTWWSLYFRCLLARLCSSRWSSLGRAALPAAQFVRKTWTGNSERFDSFSVRRVVRGQEQGWNSEKVGVHQHIVQQQVLDAKKDPNVSKNDLSLMKAESLAIQFRLPKS